MMSEENNNNNKQARRGAQHSSPEWFSQRTAAATGRHKGVAEGLHGNPGDLQKGPHGDAAEGSSVTRRGRQQDEGHIGARLQKLPGDRGGDQQEGGGDADVPREVCR